MEADSDLHLVIASPDDPRATMIVELPESHCVGISSPWRTQLAQARAAFVARHHPGRGLVRTDESITVTGVVFFDFIHGQTGVAPNGIELHPVLSFDAS